MNDVGKLYDSINTRIAYVTMMIDPKDSFSRAMLKYPIMILSENGEYVQFIGSNGVIGWSAWEWFNIARACISIREVM